MPFGHGPFDAGISAVAFGFLAHIGHRERHALGHPGAKWDAGGLAACHIVKRFKPGVAHNSNGQKIHQSAANTREGNQFAAINIGWGGLAGGQNKGLICIEMHSFNFQQHSGGQPRDFALVGIACWYHEQGPLLLCAQLDTVQ